jgi:glycosyltransferase involved in cell wall biosynthesis
MNPQDRQHFDKSVPLLSIVVPVYNVESYLTDCLHPLHDFAEDIELILVNDGSTDGSLKILKSFSAARPNTEIVDQTNAGLSAARNAGLKKASGNFVFFLDSDDIAIPEQLLAACRDAATLKTDIMQCQAEVFCGNETLRLLRPANSRKEKEVLTGAEFFTRHVKAGEFPIPVWNNIFRREFLQRNKLGFVDGIIHEDEDFTPKAFMLAKHAAFKNTTIYRYRVRDDSITGTHRFSNAKTIPSFLKISQEYISLLGDPALNCVQKNLASIVLVKCYVHISRCFTAQKELLPPQLTPDILSVNKRIRQAIPSWWSKTRLLRYYLKNRKLGIE